MHISNDRYFRDRQRHDLALRMIRHEARTCTIRCCTGLSDDRIRRLYKTYIGSVASSPVRRRRGKSPRQTAFFTRNARLQRESSFMAGVFNTFGLVRSRRLLWADPLPIEFGEMFCTAYETHLHLQGQAAISFEHAWFLLQLLNRSNALSIERCRHCRGQYLRDPLNVARRTCPMCMPKSLLQQDAMKSRRGGE